MKKYFKKTWLDAGIEIPEQVLREILKVVDYVEAVIMHRILKTIKSDLDSRY